MADAAPSASTKGKTTPKTAKASAAEAVGGDPKKRFEVKKWNAVALWAWDIVVDNCAICRNHIMDLCKCAPLGGMKNAHTYVRYRVPGESRITDKRRVHGCMGYLQRKS